MKKLITLILVCLLAMASITVTSFATNDIKINKTSATLLIGSKDKLKIKGTDAQVKWKSKNNKIATVSKNGKVTGKSVGVTKIVAKVSGVKNECVVTVNSPFTNLTEDEIVSKLLTEMTVEEKVGQMFYVRCPLSDAVNTIKKYNLGGYILFGQDFKNKTKSQIVNNINSYQKASEIPMLIGVDEEGGTVVRVSSNPLLRKTKFLSPKDTYKQGGWKGIKKDAKEKAQLLLSLGINVNMAPVCDISSVGSFMYDRSFSSNVNKVNKFVKKYVSVTDKENLGIVLKHFPGYGNTSDTHTGIAYDNRPYSQFEKTDFNPFITGIENGADCILVAHNIVKSMDKKYPASLSKKVHKIIREDLNFNGVIMTDDLSMDAIRDYTGNDTAAVYAVKSGNDILCCTDVSVQYPAVVKAVKNNDIPLEQINESVERIIRWKCSLGLFK